MSYVIKTENVKRNIENEILSNIPNETAKLGHNEQHKEPIIRHNLFNHTGIAHATRSKLKLS